MTSNQAKLKSAGIDLGTTNSLIAIIEAGQSSLVPNFDGTCLTPSIVCFSTNPGEECIVGGLAKRQTIANSYNTFYSVKRLMGLKFSDLSPDLVERVPYTIVPDDKNNIRLKCAVLNKMISPEEVSAAILRTLVADATSYLGESIHNVVITVPAYFSEPQRRATLDAAKIANISVEQLLNEPTAAGLAYGLDPAVRPDLDSSKAVPEITIFFDLGGGTFDVSVMDLDIASGIVEVRSTSGDCFLGGDDFSALLCADITKATIETVGAKIAAFPKTMQRINDKAEIAKLALSTSEEVTINMPYITQDHAKCEATLTRVRFEEQIIPLIEQVNSSCIGVLESCGSKPPTSLILVGGSTRIPAIRRLAAEVLDKEPCFSGNPDELVARGAAIQAGLKNGELDTGIVLSDITPLTLGVEEATGIVTPIITRGAGLPAVGEEVFTLLGEMGPGTDSTVPVKVIQGERPTSTDSGNRLVGILDLPISEEAVSGESSILVKFTLDASEILTVTVIDLTIMREVTTVFSDTANLTQAELNKLIKVAEQNAPGDLAKAALQGAIGNANIVCREVQTQYGKDTLDTIIFDTAMMRLDACISAIKIILEQGITEIASRKQQVWRDKCSQTIVMISDVKWNLKKYG